jgi:hypothetical protein
MSDFNPLPPTEAELLRHEAFINELLKARLPKDKPERSGFWHFLESTGGAALITAVIVGLAGSLITYVFQTQTTEREFQQSWLKARGDQAMVAYKNFVESREVMINRVFNLVGSVSTASEEYLNLSKSSNAVANYEGQKKVEASKYRDSLKEKFESNKTSWRAERDQLGFLIGYYYPKQPEISTAWHALRDAVTTNMTCVETWQKDNPIEDDTDKACPTERSEVTNKVLAFTNALEARRTYAWEGWESPEKLRQALEKR